MTAGRILLIIWGLLVGSILLHGQQMLKKEVSITVSETKIRKILKELETQTNITFAYNNNVVPTQIKRSLSVVNKPLEYVLDDLFEGYQIAYTEINQQVALFPSRKKPPPPSNNPAETSTIQRLIKPDQYSFSGTLKDKNSGELLAGVHAFIPALGKGVITNEYGFYSLTLPEDVYTIEFTFIGYKTIEQDINLDADTRFDVELEVADLQLPEIIVEGQKEEDQISQQVEMSKVDIPLGQIQNLPAFLGEKDVFKVLQHMPGVQTGTEGLSGLNVRGGAPDQNLILVDEAPIYRPQHLFGLFSSFNGEALRDAKLLKGGFSSKYGGRLSSVMDLYLKEGNKERLQGAFQMGLLAGSASLEGPFKKDKASFQITGRRTYWDLLLNPVLENAANGGLVPGYNFHDLTGKVQIDLSPKNRLFISTLYSKDVFFLRSDTMPDQLDVDWGNIAGSVRWNHLFNNKIFLNTTLAATNYQFQVKQQEVPDGDTILTNSQYISGVSDLITKMDLTWYYSPEHTLRGGWASIFHVFTPRAAQSSSGGDQPDINVESRLLGWENSVYIEDLYKPSRRLKVQAGFRFTLFSQQEISFFSVEPRLSAAWMVGRNSSIKGSYTLTTQPIHLLTNPQLGLPTDFWFPASAGLPPQRAHQVALGLVRDFPKIPISISFELYYKRMERILNLREGLQFPVFDEAISNQGEFNWTQWMLSGNGNSAGMEWLVRKKEGRLTGWISYTLSSTRLKFEDINLGNSFRANYDRRHNVSVAGVYTVNPKFVLSWIWTYGTGRPFTLPAASYVVWDPVTQNHIRIESPAEKNGFLTTPYHRLDCSIELVKRKKNRESRWIFGAYNAYNRRNPFLYYTTTETVNGVEQNKINQVNGLRLIPTIAYRMKFL